MVLLLFRGRKRLSGGQFPVCPPGRGRVLRYADRGKRRSAAGGGKSELIFGGSPQGKRKFRAPARRKFHAPARVTFLIKEKSSKVDLEPAVLRTPFLAAVANRQPWRNDRVRRFRQPRRKPGIDWLPCTRPSRFAAGCPGGSVKMTFLSAFCCASHKKTIEKPSGHFRRGSARSRGYRTASPFQVSTLAAASGAPAHSDRLSHCTGSQRGVLRTAGSKRTFGDFSSVRKVTRAGARNPLNDSSVRSVPRAGARNPP